MTSFRNVSGGRPLAQTQSLDTILEYRVALALVKYVLILIILLGTIGNILSVLVLLRKRMRGTSIHFYLTCLACADTVVLYVSGFKTWLRVVTGFEMLHVSAASCKVLTLLFMLSLHVSAWLIVLVTADRFIAVVFPFRKHTWCSVRRSKLHSGAMLLLLTGYLLHLLWTVDLAGKPGPDGTTRLQCAPRDENKFMNGPFNYIKFASYSIVPFVLVLSMNIGIILRTFKHSQQNCSEAHESLTYYSSACVRKLAQKRLRSGRQQVTVMLLLVSFMWLFLSVPFTLYSLLPLNLPTPQDRATAFLGKTVCFLLMYLNHSINFLLYCIAGRRFRLALQHMTGERLRQACASGKRDKPRVFTLRELPAGRRHQLQHSPPGHR